jgi:hypothetical protein
MSGGEMKFDLAVDGITEEPGPVDTACRQVQAAIMDRKENGGTQQQIRAAALRLIKTVFNELDADDR